MEGQVRGIARMIERDEACLDVMQQTAALRAAVDSVTMLVMEDHVQGCLARAASSGEGETVADEVIDVLRRGMGRPGRVTRPTLEP
jgi:DNA-binding FrmR family transcriptional regulator